ncbi:MAG: lytic transglycosylase domain-containing protein [Ideonella sp.]|nr:lytic transglycosylase domain-containing protein [Ideonella sp.]
MANSQYRRAMTGLASAALLWTMLGSPAAAASSVGAGVPAVDARPMTLAAADPRGPRATRASAPVADPIVDAREAFRRRDGNRLAALKATLVADRHPLAQWVDYWELNLRLPTADASEVAAFYDRWRGTYVEDRLRNDWLLELGRRGDWARFVEDRPRFRMNDDREVHCYTLLTEHQAGRPVREAALQAWLAQRDADEGCAAMAAALVESRVFTSADAWRKARFAFDANRPRAARQAVSLISPGLDATVADLAESPARFLARQGASGGRTQDELTTLALIRQATTDPGAAAQALNDRWEAQLPDDLKAWAWALVGKHSAIRLQAEAPDHFQRAALFTTRAGLELDWPDDTLAWKARAGLRANDGQGRWQQVVQAVNAMGPTEQRDPTWVFWKARALEELAGSSQDGESLRQQAREMLEGIAGQFHFYGKLASDRLERPMTVPARPAPLTPAERDAAERHPGLTRGLQLLALGLRSEGVREWNFSLRGMGDRELLAAAQRACDREVWDRCINTSDRTRTEIDLLQRFPTPMRAQVVAQAREAGLDPAVVYGLIRQESRFIMDARSVAGASGLMQLMPATARWTARKVGLEYTPAMINDRDVNLRLGTAYLRLVLDDFGGSLVLAAAGYNAGPNRPRRWREGPVLESAAFVENIPFNETRDYVKKVLSNAVYYSVVLGGVLRSPPALPVPVSTAPAADAAASAAGAGRGAEPAMPATVPIPPALREQASLVARLGRTIGPREPGAPASDRSLP